MTPRWHVPLLLGVTCAASPGRAAAGGEPGARVLILLPAGPLAGVDAGRFVEALRLYLGEVEVTTTVEPLPTPADDAPLAAVRAAGAAHAAQIVIWPAADEASSRLVVHAVALASGESEVVSFAVRYPRQPGGGFYRLVALKLRSLLWALEEGRDEPPASTPAVTAASEPAEAAAPARAWRASIEVALRSALTGPRLVGNAGLGLGLGVELDRWWVGLVGTRDLEQQRRTAEGVGATTADRLLLSGRAPLWEPAGVAVWAEVGAGVLLVEGSGHMQESSDRRSMQLSVAMASFAAVVGVPLGERVQLLARMGLDLFRAPARMFLHATRFYSSGPLSPYADLAAGYSF